MRSEDGRMLEDPGRFYWKWLAVGTVLLVVYVIEHYVRTGQLIPGM